MNLVNFFHWLGNPNFKKLVVVVDDDDDDDDDDEDGDIFFVVQLMNEIVGAYFQFDTAQSTHPFIARPAVNVNCIRMVATYRGVFRT